MDCMTVCCACRNSPASDYQPGSVPGALVDGVRSEDLTRLTYPDAVFDLVLTSETLEHVPDLDAALREIRRVLVPGGRHIFTVPVLPQTTRTFPRAILRPDGSVEDRAPRIAHPGGDWGYPVFTEFGADLPGSAPAGGLRGRRLLRPDARRRPGPGLCLSQAGMMRAGRHRGGPSRSGLTRATSSSVR